MHTGHNSDCCEHNKQRYQANFKALKYEDRKIENLATLVAPQN
jgi:hypothetical protein